MNNTKKLVILPGDGIGQEITSVAKEVISKLNKDYQANIEYKEFAIGGTAYDLFGTPLPDDTLDECKKADAVLLGAVGGYKWDELPFAVRPERALLKLRKSLGLYANIRPIEVFEQLSFCSPLKNEVIKDVNLVIIRELTGDLYFGEPRGIEVKDGQKVGINTMIYWQSEIARIAEVAFQLAAKRNNQLCSVDKANVLEASVLWRETVNEIGKKYPHVQVSHQYVDNAAMQLIKNPRQFDCILSSNMFGDILSDLAAMIPGSIGLLTSVSMGDKVKLYEPIHGSAPDIAGQDIANPLATVLCLALMLENSYNNKKLSDKIREAVYKALQNGRTADLSVDSIKKVGCQQMGQLVINQL